MCSKLQTIHCHFVFMLSSVGNGVHPGSFASPCTSNVNFLMPRVNPCRIFPWIELQSCSPSCQATARESDWLGLPHLGSDWLWGHQTAYIALQIWHQSETDWWSREQRWKCRFRFEERTGMINNIRCAFIETSRQLTSCRCFLGRRADLHAGDTTASITAIISTYR